MCLRSTIKALNPLRKLARTPASRATEALLSGQTLLEVMREASDAVAREAVREALEEFSDGPAALLITCLLESATAGWQQLGADLRASSRVPSSSAAWVSARMHQYADTLGTEVMTQHLINLVLSVTGLHVEALILTRADVDADRLTDQLAELLKKGLSSGLSRTDLAQTLSTAPRPAGRFVSAS